MFTIPDFAILSLALARDLLKRGQTPQSVRLLLEDCAAILNLYRPPEYESFNPGPLFKKNLGPDDAQHAFTFEPVTDAVGDPKQILQMIALVLRSARLEEATVLVANLFQQPDPVEKEGVPCLALSFDGGGGFRYPLPLEGGLGLPMDELRARWTLATRGGRIDDAPNGLLLRQKGARLAVEPTTEFEPLREAVEAAATAPSAESVEHALRIAEGEPKLDPADVRAIVEEAFRLKSDELHALHIECQLLFASELPPIALWRAGLLRFFGQLFAFTAETGDNATLDILFEYEAAQSAVVFVATLTTPEKPLSFEACMASLKHIVEDVHHGALEIESGAKGFSFTVTLPDTVGKTVDQWIPGYGAFSDQSKKILRLLKSGGPVPPEDFLLQGVLEEELARWLMPLLDQAPAVNVANAIATEAKPAFAASMERLKKAVDQIKKGKPKREIAKPAFAAEIIAAYSTDDRRRAAIGAGKLNQSDLQTLAKDLTAPNPPYVDILRLLARRV